MKRRFAFPIAVVACVWPRSYSGPYDPREPEALAIEPAQPPTTAACSVTPPPVLKDARWRPSVTGSVSVVDVRGDPRLTVDESALVTWSADASKLAVADKKAVAIWRARDAALLDLVPYSVGAVTVTSSAWSDDGGRIALAVPEPHGAAGPLKGRGVIVRVTPKHDAIELVDPSGAVRQLSAYDLESALALIDGGKRLEVARPGKLSVYELPTGKLVRDVPLPGSEMVALSPDGRRVAGWTLYCSVSAPACRRRPRARCQRRFWPCGTSRAARSSGRTRSAAVIRGTFPPTGNGSRRRGTGSAAS